MEIKDIGIPVVNVKLVNGGRIGGSEVVEEPSDAVMLIANELVDQAREVMYVININARGRVLSAHQAGLGTTNYATVTGKDIFQAALLSNASSIILIHNHPGQDPMPSEADYYMTKVVSELGQHLGITVEDHIIVAGGNAENIMSFRDNHLL